jgi:pimeloyl-ACP methyl ester carboxylesterase
MRLAVVPVAVALALVPLGSGAEPRVALRPCVLAGDVSAQCTTIRVPEHRGTSGRTIGLRVAVVRARDGGSRRDPLVYVTGGPGGSAVAAAAGAVSMFWRINATRDLVLVDQRGTGGSNRLLCPAPAGNATVTTSAEIRDYVRRCLASLRADPRDYTTVPAMDDLADVLRILGYAQANLYGGSYGATAVQYFLVQHPDLVRTAILDGATLLDVPLFEHWGRNGQQAMNAILARCAGTPRCARAYPRVQRELFEVMAMVRRVPVRVAGTTIDAATAAGGFQQLSRTPEGAAQIPWLAHRARAGDWLPFQLALEDSDTDDASMRLVMRWSIVCNEPWARQDPARTAAASAGTYLAEWTAQDAAATATVCAEFPKAPQPTWSRSRVRSDRPVLLVVGGSDPQDPAANVAGARRELPNSRTVVLPGSGHGSVQLGCMPRVAARFVERGSAAALDLRCAARYRPPQFGVAG